MQNEEARKRTVEKAIQMFNQNGCKSVTMDTIASTLHISKRTLYEMFDSKEALLLECLTEVHRTLGKERLKILKQTQEPFLMTLYLTRNETSLNIRYARILSDAEKYYPELTSRILRIYSDRFKDALRRVLSEAQEHGDLRSGIDIEETVETLAVIIRNGSCNNSTSDPKLTIRIREIYYTFFRGLLSISAIQRYDQNEEFFKQTLDNI